MTTSNLGQPPLLLPLQPFFRGADLIMYGTNEPPKSSTHRQLSALDEDPASNVTLSIARRRFFAAFGAPIASFRQARIPEMTVELDKLKTRSPAQVRLIVASSLWTRFGVALQAHSNDKVVLQFEDLNPHAIAAPGPDALKDAVNEMKNNMKEDDRDYRRVAEADSPDLFFSFAAGPAMLSKPWTCLLLDCLSDAISVPLYLTKHLLNVPRPSEVDKTIKPTLPLPKHASYPGGHATYMSVIEHVLDDLLDLGKDPQGHDAGRLSHLKSAIAEARELAGLHTGLDTVAGVELGLWLGARLVEAGNAGSPAPWAALYAEASAEWV